MRITCVFTNDLISMCPSCKKNSYSSDEESFHACPYCGFKFSGRYGPDRRAEERIRQGVSFDFPHREQHFQANTINVSEKGLSVEILDDPPIKGDDILTFTIGDQHIKAKVIWMNKLPDRSFAGLERLN